MKENTLDYPLMKYTEGIYSHSDGMQVGLSTFSPWSARNQTETREESISL